MQVTRELIAIAASGRADAPGAIDAIAARRRELASALIAAGGDGNVLAALLGEVSELAAWSIPWEPTAADFTIANGLLEQWRAQPVPAANVVMAVMALAPSHQGPTPVRLALLPAWLRVPYARFLLASPPIFLAAGEAERFGAHAGAAMAELRRAILDDRLGESLDLARLVLGANCVMIYFNEQSLRGYFRDKALISEWHLSRNGCSLGYAMPLSSHAPPRVGILHRSLAPGTETFYLLAHMAERDRTAMEMTLYLLGEPEGGLTEVFQPWVDGMVHLPEELGAAVARIREDDLDLCLVAKNVAVGVSMEFAIFAHRLARVQVIGDASPLTPGLSSGDIFLTSQAHEPGADAQADYEEGLVRMQGGSWYFGFAHDADPQTISCTRASFGVPEDHVLFFSASNYFKLTPEVLQTWAEILARTPNSSLAMMPFNANWQSDYPVQMFLRRLDRVLALNGISPGRVKTLTRVPTRADLQAVMALADIYLDSFPYPGACSLVDPLQVGLPIVARDGGLLRTTQAASVLRMERLDSAVCPETEAYIQRAVRLASDKAYRGAEAKAVRAAAEPSLTCLATKPLAEKFTAFCVDAVGASWEHLSTLRSASSADLRESIRRSAEWAFAAPPPALTHLVGRNVIVELVIPCLQSLIADGRAKGRVVDVGGDTASNPFIAAGIDAKVVEPGPDGVSALAADCLRINPRVAGFDILRSANFADGGPALIVLGCATAAPAALIEEMQAKGYGSVVFETKALEAFGSPNWNNELVGVVLDPAAPDSQAGAASEIVFYRRSDTSFLVCLAQLLEGFCPAQSRPAFAAMQAQPRGRRPARAHAAVA